jgi:hypothetical protein
MRAAPELAHEHEALVALFDDVERAVRAGLSLRQASALHGVTERRLSGWIYLSDQGREPWAEFVLGLLRANAARRLREFEALRGLATADGRATRAVRAKHGARTRLERELQLLRARHSAPVAAHEELRRMVSAFRAASPESLRQEGLLHA